MRLIFLIVLAFPYMSFGHGGNVHTKQEAEPLNQNDPLVNIYANINLHYKHLVEPIFKAKCFDCHSALTKYPWYYSIPGINLLMNSHIKDARSHIDMTDGFPFKSHETPQADLKELKKTVINGNMPPWYYRPFHEGSELTTNEAKTILGWIEESLAKLKESK
ncbi:MAG TPA: heme-binding domain-containing protein [Bacteriovoracaceae bacterium]|nr:heme-binding domain-containing protein [Bacteriovoracaceae bacterium]